MRKIIVTCGLPYANGQIHLGHILEHIQADIWVRWQKLQGNTCIFICGDDAHGTPIMLKAQQLEITPEELIQGIKQQHEADFAGFNIDFDNYYTTHSPENRELSANIYRKLLQNGDIETREIAQLYDPVAEMFLPDRFVKGTCPKCAAPNQYGDNCEVCGTTYATTELLDPVSAVSGSTPVIRHSVHYFFRLDKYADMLKSWAAADKHLQPEIINKLNEWFSAGLKQWDISRDTPYFGFEIPDAPGKYFYVWLDAPIGYIASFQNLANRNGDLNFNEYWNADSVTELYHFVGKDIIYFHALFWPAILQSAGLRKPSAIFTHGFVTVNGKKMSKSQGTFIQASDYLQHLDAEYLRYYFAAKLTSNIDDIDLNFADFMQKVNSDLVGKVINIASRCAKFINNNFANVLAAELDASELINEFSLAAAEIAQLYEARNYSAAIKIIMVLADKANQYIDGKKPWSLAKQMPQDIAIQQICTTGLNLFRILIVYLQPVLPKLALQVTQFLQTSPLAWDDSQKPLLAHTIATFQPLMQRIDQKAIDALLEIDNVS